MEEGSFYTLFCAKFKCPPAEFEITVLWRTVSFGLLPFVRLLWQAKPAHFAPDFVLINAIKDLTSYYKIREVVNYYNIQPQKKSFLRRNLKLRMSKGRLLRLAADLFPVDE